MQKLITKYGLAAHLALAAVAPLFLSPGVVLWLAALAAVWLVLEPSQIGNERLHGARSRVARAIAADPLFWVCLLLVVVAVISQLNSGVALSYDAEFGKWFLSPASFPLLPGSVEGIGCSRVSCAAAGLVVIQGCRHGLGRSARGAFAFVTSLISGTVAFVWAMLVHEGMPFALAAVECLPTDPSFSGCVYGIYLMFSVMALVMCFERQWLLAMPLNLFAISGNLLGLFLFSPPIVAAVFAGAVIVVFVYAFFYLRFTVGKFSECKFLVFLGLGIGLATVAAMATLPREMLDVRIAPFLTGAFVPDGYVKARAALSEVATRIWKGSPWLGCGLGAYALNLQFHATPSEWSVISPLQKVVPNGYWLLLAERGVVGAFLLAVPACLLMATYVMRLIRGVTLGLPNPMAWTGFVLFIVAAMEMLVDVSFLSPAALVALATTLALAANTFPKESKTNV